MGLTKVLLFVRTVSYLDPAQPLHRVRLRIQRVILGRYPGLLMLRASKNTKENVGWPDGFRPSDATCEWPPRSELDNGEITLLGETRKIDNPPNWDTDADSLWNFHLHYWDWSWGLHNDPDRLKARSTFSRLFSTWTAQTRLARGEEWSPYVASLRAWSWCGVYSGLVQGGELEDQYLKMLRYHSLYLQANLELDVGGNHLIKNLKALIGLGMFLGDEALVGRSLNRLRRQLSIQILSDGGHFERAPSYHCQVLADLLDLKDLLGFDDMHWLSSAIVAMRTWLGLVLLPDGTVPLLNDGYAVGRGLLDHLCPGPAAPSGHTVLRESGLVVLRRGPYWLLADVGSPCPDSLPAHAHADSLGFLLFHGFDLLVGEAFTSTYSAGPLRRYERGTAAHSTVQIDDADSTEVWGAFRAARRARTRVQCLREESSGTVVLRASQDGYARLRGHPMHARTWILDDQGLQLVDEVTGRGAHQVGFRLHGTPASAVASSSAPLMETVTSHATGWKRRGQWETLQRLEFVKLPWRFEVHISIEERARRKSCNQLVVEQ